MTETDHFKALSAELSVLQELAEKPGVIAFFAQECMRFYSIAGSLRETFDLNNETAEERYIVHILGRSLLEGFFWVVYIFDNVEDREARYEKSLMSFEVNIISSGTKRLSPIKCIWNPLILCGLS